LPRRFGNFSSLPASNLENRRGPPSAAGRLRALAGPSGGAPRL